MRRWLMLVGLAAVLMPGVLACRATAPAAGPAGPEPAAVTEVLTGSAATARQQGDNTAFAFEPVPPGGPTELVVGQGQEPDSLYLYGGTMLAGSHIMNSIYDGPIEGLDYDFQPVILKVLPKLEVPGSGAELALVTVQPGERYLDPESQLVLTATEVISDLAQITVRFTMVDDLTWQDGAPVTAADSVYSARLACDPATATSKTLCDRTARYVRIDDRTVEWRGLPGYTDQTYFTNFYTPIARHQPGRDGRRMDRMSAREVAEDETFSRRPYAYGPFQVEEWVAGEYISLVRNPYYWRAGDGLPYLEQVTHRFIKDSNRLLAALLAEEVDVATQDALDITQFDALEQARAEGRITPYYVSGTVWEHIDFNLDPVDARIALGACKQVRQAMAMGTDRQAMVDSVQKGQTRIQNTFVPEEHWAYPTAGDLATYPFDPTAAQQLLDELGFRDGDGDGVREAQHDITCPVTISGDGEAKDQVIPRGTRLALTLNTTGGNAMREATTLLFQSNMQAIGVKVNLKYVDSDIFFDKTADGRLTGRRYDLGQFAWLTGVQPPVALYFCDNIPTAANGWAGQNNTGWCNPTYDSIAKRADTTLERAAAVPLYADAQRIWADELPVLPLFARVKVMATRPDLMNFVPNATVNSETWNIETWGLRPPQ